MENKPIIVYCILLFALTGNVTSLPIFANFLKDFSTFSEYDILVDAISEKSDESTLLLAVSAVDLMLNGTKPLLLKTQ